MLMLLIRLFPILILSTFEQITFFWNEGVYTPTLKKHQVVRDLKKFENHCSRGKHTTRRSTVGIWSEVRVYRTPAMNIPWAGVLRFGKFPDKRRLKCCNVQEKTYI